MEEQKNNSNAIIFPVILLIVGLLLVVPNYPNIRRENITPFDVGGTICIMITLTALLGWRNIYIIAGFIIALVFVLLLIKIEHVVAEPLILLQLFRNKEYLTVLAVGGITFYYRGAVSIYVPLAMQKVVETSATISGLLQMPRTILTIILPTAFGAWVGGKKERLWIAMVFYVGIVVISFLSISFVTPSIPILLFFVATAFTCVAESFCSVSVTTIIQKSLSISDVGIGTALSTFANTFAMIVSSVINGFLLV